MSASASLVSAVWLAVWLAALLASVGHEREREEEAQRVAARIRDGDIGAFRRFFDATHTDLLRALRRHGLNAAAAEDVAQKAYVWLWEHRDRIDETKSLRGLLFRIGLTRGLNLLRDHGRTRCPTSNWKGSARAIRPRSPIFTGRSPGRPASAASRSMSTTPASCRR